MEQYKNTGSQPAPTALTKDPQGKSQTQQLETKITTLENFVHSQGKELLKLRRDISRLKADIDILSNQLSKRG